MQIYENTKVPSNGEAISTLKPRLQRLMTVTDDEFANAVKSLVTKGIFTTDAIAEIIHKEYRQTCNYLDGTTPFKVSQYAPIALEAHRRGDDSLLKYFVPEGFALTPLTEEDVNGCLVDELVEGVHALDCAKQNFESGDLDAADRAADEAVSVANRMKKEVAKKRRGR
jgi:hypothetical protein